MNISDSMQHQTIDIASQQMQSIPLKDINEKFNDEIDKLLKISEANPQVSLAVEQIIIAKNKAMQTIAENMCMPPEEIEKLKQRREESEKLKEELEDRIESEHKIEA